MARVPPLSSPSSFTRLPDPRDHGERPLHVQPATLGKKDDRAVGIGIAVFVAAMTVVGIFGVTSSVRTSIVRATMDSTFAGVHQHEQDFHTLNNRFASWRELEDRGATLPARLRVVASNADSSHWFLSLLDRSSGMVCDRTGELFDETGNERSAVCRSVPQ